MEKDDITQVTSPTLAYGRMPVDEDLQCEGPQEGPFQVDFTGHHDPDDPKNWSQSRKWAITAVMLATGFIRILVSSIMAPALLAIALDLHMNEIESVMSMSVYILSTAFGHLLIAPLSEVYGRRPLLHMTNVWALVWNLTCGFANGKGLLMAARLLGGFGAGAIYVLASGVLSDIWRQEKRGKSLGFYSLVPVLGAAVGPILGGLIAQNVSWRWVFWGTSIFQTATVTGSFVVFKETYALVILRQKAGRLRVTTGDQRYFARVEQQQDGRTATWVLQRSFSRPLRMLLFYPIVQIQAVLSGFNYGITYLVITTYAIVWTSKYYQTTAVSGLHYIAMCMGEVVAFGFGGPLMDVVIRYLRSRHQGSTTPEFRAPIMIPPTIITVAGFLCYGWSAESMAFWLLVEIGAALLSVGNQVASMAIQAYVIDSYPDHVSSASAGAQLYRSLTAFGFPLFAPAMYSTMGYGWANSLLALVSAALIIPATLFIWFHGARMRAKSKSSF